VFFRSPSVQMGNVLFLEVADNLVKVWSASGGKEVNASLAGHKSQYVHSVAFSPDGQHIVSGSGDNLVKVWSVSGGKEVASLAGHASNKFIRSPSARWATYCFSKWKTRQLGEDVVVNGTLLFYYISHNF
jgi:WD40 repeat protein